MMRGPSMLAWVRSAQRSLLPAVAFKHGRVQIQTVARRTFRKPRQLPIPQAGEKSLTLSLTEALEQVANGVITRKACDPQQGLQGHIRTQQTRVCKAPCSSHHREQKCREGLHRIDGVGGSEIKRQMLAHRFAITYLPQKLEEHHQTTERGDRSLGLAQFHFFSAPKSGNFPVHCFVLLGVSFIQLKLNRVRVKQCYSISEFRLSSPSNPLYRLGKPSINTGKSQRKRSLGLSQ